MSFTVPLEMLSSMQVSLRVALPEGTFALNMANADDADLDPVLGSTGIQLRMQTVKDAHGVTLLLSVSGVGMDSRGCSTNSRDYEDVASPTNLPASLPAMSLDEMFSYPFAPLVDEATLSYGANDSHCLRPTFTDQDLFDSFNFGVCSPETSNTQHVLESEQGCLSLGEDVADMGMVRALFDNASRATTPLSSEASPSSPSSSSSSSSPRSPASMPLRRKRPTSLRCPEPHCDRAFTSQYTLAKHVKAHERKEKKYFPCSLGCAMRFSRKHDRLRHEVTQHGRLCEWGCPICLGFFSSESTLNKHKCKAAATASRW
ncbi:hypothetical protein C8F01DRAFT_791610 [Mycena amicta]|nr:hypothetical protein C8F01DRAFT_791610 [Mycena amicta]